MFFFLRQKPPYESAACLVGSERCIRDSPGTSPTVPGSSGGTNDMLPFVPPDEPGTVGEVPGLPEVRLYDVLGFGGLPVVPPDSATTPLTEDSV